jgi:hypothetical protein
VSTLVTEKPGGGGGFIEYVTENWLLKKNSTA